MLYEAWLDWNYVRLQWNLMQVELPGVVRCVEWSHGLCLRFACCCNGFKAWRDSQGVALTCCWGSVVQSWCEPFRIVQAYFRDSMERSQQSL